MEITLTRAQLEAARTKLASNGIALSGDSGEIEHDGVRIHFNYTGDNAQEGVPAETLTIAIVKKPFYIPASTINDEIAKWFNG